MTPPLRTPKPGRGWKRVAVPHCPPTAVAWRRKQLLVFSDYNPASREWLVSVSAMGHRASDAAVAMVRADFEMERAEEESLSRGTSRQLWAHVPAEALTRIAC